MPENGISKDTFNKISIVYWKIVCMDDQKQSSTKDPSCYLHYQRRLSNYLKTYRFKNNISSKAMASTLGYAPSRYSRLESENIPFDRFTSSIDFLKMLANINSLSLIEFVSKLEGVQGNQDGTAKWQSKLIDTFENVSSKTLRTFLDTVNVDTKAEKDDLEDFLNLYIKLKKGSVSKEVTRCLIQLVRELAK